MPKHYFELDVDSEWMTRCTLRHNALCGQQNVRCGWHNAWCGQCKACEVWWVGQNQSLTPPHGKNKFLLNEYLGILMHFESTFLFFQIWKMDFFRPTHPLNLENSRFFLFLNPSLRKRFKNLFLKIMENSIIGRRRGSARVIFHIHFFYFFS